MMIVEFYQALGQASNVHGVEEVLDAFLSVHGSRLTWTPVVNKDNNKGISDTKKGTLMIYYSTIYPKYAEQRSAFEKRDAAREAQSLSEAIEAEVA